jgi:hypothetical protein
MRARADVPGVSADLVVVECVTHQLVAAGGARDANLSLTLAADGTAGTG